MCDDFGYRDNRDPGDEKEYNKEEMRVNMDYQYLERDLSVENGLAHTPKDFHWFQKSVPCQAACPAKTDIPGYLAAISAGDLETAYRINLQDNVFPAVLGRICTRPCEPACRHGFEGLGDPVAICNAKRSSADFREREASPLPPFFPASGKSVAIIGSGPAGLAAARDLVLMGHTVTVYEKYPRAGGMLSQNIPPFRLPRDVVTKEVEQIELQGVKIHCNAEVGKDISLADLLEKNDALIVAGGCTRPNVPQLDNLEARGIYHGSTFLNNLIEEKNNDLGDHVIIIGGGFTAVDCARGALLSGAKSVSVYYRRQQRDMTLTPGEFEAMSEEGINIHFLSSPRKIITHKGRLQAVQLIRNRACQEEDHTTQKTRIEEIPDSEIIVPADTLLLATGQAPSWEMLQEICNVSGSGSGSSWSINPDHLPRTQLENVFVAGDQGSGSSSVIEAVASGRDCSRVVDEYLMGQKRLQPAITINHGRNQYRDEQYNDIPRQKIEQVAIKMRTFSKEVEQGFAEDVAKQETKRCYLCHYKYEIDTSRCIYCDLCREVKPLPDCILHVQSLDQDDNGRIYGYRPPKDNYSPENQFVYRINPSACIRCNRCLEVCPVNCIDVHRVNLEVNAKVSSTGQTIGPSL